jgi:hypothetical protein
MALISKKKPVFEISPALRKYLKDTHRQIEVAVTYHDLLRYDNSITLEDKHGKDTLWETVFFAPKDMANMQESLKKIYALLKSGGDTSVMDHLYIDRVDLCLHGNTKPFRIRIVNRINDLFDYFYLKEADASRVYGLELEHLLSPNKINYLVTGNTLIEEHIPGIPGAQFIDEYLNKHKVNMMRLAKEFVKFNERCLVQLLGDMRTDNYVVEIIPDFDETYYRIRAIDFDQACFDGRKAIYMPQYFKENNPIIKAGMKLMTPILELQYQKEERARIANRIRSVQSQLELLLQAMCQDQLSTPERVQRLKQELAELYGEPGFLEAGNMGEILKLSLEMVFKKPVRLKYNLKI